MNVDDRILELLEKDSRMSNVEISKLLKVSEGTVRNKISRMTKEGVIKNFSIERGTSKGFTAFVLINDSSIEPKKIMESILKVREVKGVYELAGEYDAILKIVANSPEDFNDVIDKIRSIDGIESTETLTVLKSW